MATDLKRLKQHFKAYEPTLKELKRKYQVRYDTAGCMAQTSDLRHLQIGYLIARSRTKESLRHGSVEHKIFAK